jgi:hypothetical protein
MTPEQRVEEAALEIAAVRCLYGRQLPVKAMARAALASSEKLIAELEARIARKDALLKPFADSLGTVAPTDFTRWPDDATIEMDGAAEMITWGDLRRARAALNEDKPHD